MWCRQLAPPLITNDGVTSAREIGVEDRFEKHGEQLVLEVASKTRWRVTGPRLTLS